MAEVMSQYTFGGSSASTNGGIPGSGGTADRDKKGAVPMRQRAQQLYDATEDWRGRWQEVKAFISPNRGRFLESSTESANKGEAADYEILNNIGIVSSRILSSGISSGLTSPSSPWFSLSLPDQDYRNNYELGRWMRDLRDLILSVLSHSNFYLAMTNVYAEIVDFGIGAMLIEEDPIDVIRCTALTIGEFQIDTDASGRPNTLYRRMWMTTDQIVQQFGYDKLPKTLQTNFKTQANTKHLVIHAIEPRDTRTLSKPLPDDMKYVSAYFMQDGTDSEDTFLRYSGYRVAPFVAPRWSVVANEKYGISPAMNALDDTRMLQRENEIFYEGLEKATDPALAGPQGLERTTAETVAGAYNATQNPGDTIVPIHVPRIDMNGHLTVEQSIVARIEEIFYVPLFQSLLGSTTRRTAEEIGEIRAEKLVQIGPVLNRIQTEALEPIIDRVIDILLGRGMLWDIPPVFADRAPDLEYDGALAQAQRSADTRQTEQWLAVLANMSQLDPNVLDRADFDAIAVDYARRTNVDPNLVRTDEEVAAIREARQKQQQQQQQAEIMATTLEPTAKAAKLMSETKVGAGGETALDSLLGRG